MDAERTMEFLLRMHAKAAARAAAHEEKMADIEERVANGQERMDEFDRRTQAIQKLVSSGMRVLVKVEEAQLRSDPKLKRLIDLMTKQRPNGHTSGN